MSGHEKVVSRDKHFNWPEVFKSHPRLLREQHEVEHIVSEFKANRDIDIDTAVHDHGIGYLYHRSEILVQFEYLAPVMALLSHGTPQDVIGELAQAFTSKRLPWQSVISGVVALQLADFKLSVPEALDRIDAAFGEGVATPNHVITVANGSPGGTAGICPATEPQTTYAGIEPFPSVCQNGGAGVRVYIADTGLLRDADAEHPWLRGVQRAHDADGTLQDWELLGKPNSKSKGLPAIPPYAGHGTFVAGLVRCMAPQAEVIVSNVFKVAGSVLEKDLVPDLANALKHGADIFNLSIAASTRKGHPLIALEKWLQHLSKRKGVACVVAAGNSGSDQPFWPGASPEVVSVGALAGDWRSRADFSNHGGWVDVYAPGRDLINAYATGMYECYAAPYVGKEREFYGMARWSGTSFSTPIVTGLIAARMSRTGENGLQAAAALLAEAQSQAIPGVGPVLLPPSGNGTIMAGQVSTSTG
ncbi:MAG TPA: S8/S53 family peptidase [Streptosporangiaceae bacterium]|nr:S8/S53 family peptidase [Streptosporangiaceae bacterium]